MREMCTKDNPSDGTPWKWYHPDAAFIRAHDAFFTNEDSWKEYECPYCGEVFKVTIEK